MKKLILFMVILLVLIAAFIVGYKVYNDYMYRKSTSAEALAQTIQELNKFYANADKKIKSGVLRQEDVCMLLRELDQTTVLIKEHTFGINSSGKECDKFYED